MSLSTDAAQNSTRCSYTHCGRNYWRANHSTPQNENRINTGRLENERQDTGRRGVSSGSERTQKRARRSPEDRLELALEVLGGTARVASILDEEKGAMVASSRPEPYKKYAEYLTAIRIHNLPNRFFVLLVQVNCIPLFFSVKMCFLILVENVCFWQ